MRALDELSSWNIKFVQENGRVPTKKEMVEEFGESKLDEAEKELENMLGDVVDVKVRVKALALVIQFLARVFDGIGLGIGIALVLYFIL